jgi:hypothetical protein
VVLVALVFAVRRRLLQYLLRHARFRGDDFHVLKRLEHLGSQLRVVREALSCSSVQRQCARHAPARATLDEARACLTQHRQVVLHGKVGAHLQRFPTLRDGRRAQVMPRKKGFTRESRQLGDMQVGGTFQ